MAKEAHQRHCRGTPYGEGSSGASKTRQACFPAKQRTANRRHFEQPRLHATLCNDSECQSNTVSSLFMHTCEQAKPC